MTPLYLIFTILSRKIFSAAKIKRGFFVPTQEIYDMKICHTCKIEKEENCFGKTLKGTYLNRCKQCNSLIRKQWDKEHPDRVKERRLKKYQKVKIKREELKTFINTKKSNGCSYCGYNTFTECLHFHHRDPSIKEYAIGNMIGNVKKIESIIEEMDKCIVLCVNCHMALHNGDIQI